MQNVKRENELQHQKVAENILLSSCAPHLLANETKDGVNMLLVEYKQTTTKSSLEITFDLMC